LRPLYPWSSGKNKYLSNESDRLNDRMPFADLPEDIDEVVLKERIERFISTAKVSLGSTLREGQSDSSFYIDMLRFNHYQVLSEVSKNIEVNEYLSDQFVNSIYDSIARIDLDDVDAMSGMAYPWLIRNYPRIMAKRNNVDYSGDFLSQIRTGQELFSGPIRTYFLNNLISDYVGKAETKKQKLFIIGVAWDHVSDGRVKQMMLHARHSILEPYKKGIRVPIFIGIVLALGTIILWIYLIKLGIKYAKRAKPAKGIEPLLAVIIIVVIAFLSPAVDLILRNPISEIWPQLSGVITILLFLVYRKWIDGYLVKRNYILYFIAFLLLTTVYFLGLYFTLHRFGDWDHHTANGLIRKWGVLVVFSSPLMSFIVSYLIELWERKKDLRFLFEHIVEHLEFVIHFLITAGLFFYFASDLHSWIGMRNMVWFLSLASVFYYMSYQITPKFIAAEKKSALLGFNLFKLLAMYICLCFFFGLFERFDLLQQNISFPLIEFYDLSRFRIFFLIVFAGLGIVYYYLRQSYFRRVDVSVRLYRKKEAELNQLRSQVNPHFLFNSLNTVYAQALKEKNEKTAESIAKLSNLMRYLIDDMDKDAIPIKKEIGYVEDYIKLQSARSSVEHDISVQVDLNEGQQEQLIAPMLMIPFVENAFKHGINPNKKSRLHIQISQEKNQLRFEIENSIDPDLDAFEKEKGFGIGIPNVRKRLEYQYPNQHRISIDDTDSYFKVVLSLELPSE